MPDFTPTQGRYLSFIHAYTNLHGIPPAEADISLAMSVSAPSVHQMVKTLEGKRLISREPGQPRSIRVLVPAKSIPEWIHPRVAMTNANALSSSTRHRKSTTKATGTVYRFSVFLADRPTGKRFGGKQIRRDLELCGYQTLEDLHEIIFEAFDRDDHHLYEFDLGEKPYEPDSPTYGPAMMIDGDSSARDAAQTTLEELDLKPGQTFRYLFDFGDCWHHHIEVLARETADPSVTYPRIVKRLGESPPQYESEDDE